MLVQWCSPYTVNPLDPLDSAVFQNPVGPDQGSSSKDWMDFLTQAGPQCPAWLVAGASRPTVCCYSTRGAMRLHYSLLCWLLVSSASPCDHSAQLSG